MSRWQSHCFVPGCVTGYKSCKKKLSLFGVPKEEDLFLKWQRNIPRADKPLERNAAVCELHFDPQFVSRHFEHVIQGELVCIDRSRPVLLPNAVPTIFPNLPKYLSKPVPKKRNAREKPASQPSSPKRRRRMDGTCCQDSEVGEAEEGSAAVDAPPPHVLEVLNVSLPTKQWAEHVFSENPLHVAYSVCLPGKDMSLLHALKMVVFRSIESVIKHEVFVRGVEVALDVPSDPASILQDVDSLSACTGAGLSAEFPLAYSNANMKQWNP